MLKTIILIMMCLFGVLANYLLLLGKDEQDEFLENRELEKRRKEYAKHL